MRKFLQVFYIFFSAILVSLAIPNELFLFGSPYIALFAVSPLYFAVAKAESFQEAFRLGFLQTMLVHIFSSFWLSYFKDFAAFTLGASALGTGLIGGILGRFLFLPYAYEQTIFRSVKNKSNLIPFRILYFASVYTLYEWFKGSALGFLAYPWGTLSSAVFRWNLFMQTASLFGTYGMTFLLAFFSALAGEALLLLEYEHRVSRTEFFAFRKTLNLFIVLFAASFIYGAYEVSKPRLAEKKINAVLVQQNQDPWTIFSDSNSITLSEKLTEESINKARSRGDEIDLVIWSEGVLQQAFPAGEAYYGTNPASEPLTDFISRMRVPFIIGGSARAKDGSANAHNAALLFSSEGNYRGFYGKLHLVPFAESLPGSEYEAVQRFLGNTIGISAGWIPGKEFSLFEIPSHRNETRNIISLFEKADKIVPCLISCPICFDDAFPADVFRPLFLHGTELFVNLTDDSWSQTNSAELQHFVIASFRAIEFRTTLVRSTNAGYSCVIDATGRVLSDLPLFKAASIFTTIPVYEREITVYALLGNWFPLLLFFSLLLFCLFLYIETDEKAQSFCIKIKIAMCKKELTDAEKSCLQNRRTKKQEEKNSARKKTNVRKHAKAKVKPKTSRSVRGAK